MEDDLKELRRREKVRDSASRVHGEAANMVRPLGNLEYLKAGVLSAEVAVKELECKIRAAELKKLWEMGAAVERAQVKEAREVYEEAQKHCLIAQVAYQAQRDLLAGTQGIIEPSTKRTRVAPFIDPFAWEVHEMCSTLDNLDNLDDIKTLNFSRSILGVAETPKVVMVRECFPRYFDAAWSLAQKGRGSVLVCGSRGVGKTFFSVYVLCRLVWLKEIVFYDGKEKWLFVPRGADVTSLNRKLLNYQHEPVAQGMIYNANQYRILLINSLSVVHLEDIGEENGPKVAANAGVRNIVMTSPNYDRLKRVGELGACLLFLPAWNECELRTLFVLEGMEPVKTALNDMFRLEILMERFNLIGGVPGAIFSTKNPVETVRNLIEFNSPETLFGSFRTFSFTTMPKLSKSLGLLVCFAPVDAGSDTPNADQQGTVSIATPALRELILKEYSQKSLDANYQFYVQVQGLKAFQGFSDYFVKMCMHKLLLRQHTITAERIFFNLGQRTEIESFEWPKRTEMAFKRVDMQDLFTFDSESYGRPPHNFSSVDSFTVLPKSLLDCKDARQCLVLLHVTASDERKILLKDLKAVHDKVCELMGIAFLPTYLLFITNVRRITKAPPILNDDGESFVRLPKFARDVKQISVKLGRELSEVANSWDDLSAPVNIRV